LGVGLLLFGCGDDAVVVDGGVDSRDGDGDGFRACTPADHPAICDCDDEAADTHPRAAEVCGDGRDQDCDGFDEACDADGDGFVAGTDCDDEDPAVRPGGEEVCTALGGAAVDEDCDGIVDEGCVQDDLDGDGVPSCTVGAPPCDCNDCDSGIYPGAVERCGDGVDQDCDGVDTACAEADADGDGYDAIGAGGTDCDDADPRVYPGAPERCGDGVAQSCDVDLDCSADGDGDGWIEPAACDDDPAVTPDAIETCDGSDNDCDGQIDEAIEGGCGAGPTAGCATAACAIDPRGDVHHCGGCRVDCNAGGSVVADRCMNGLCDCSPDPNIGPCPLGSLCCPATARLAGGCADVRTDRTRCGSCFTPCPADRADACRDGLCACGPGPVCALGQLCCDGACVPADTNAACGACGSVCGPSSSCTEGRCQCSSGRFDCDGNFANGCEVDGLEDDSNCGGCGASCPLGRVCEGGRCMREPA
jgi:hypothetical protein